MVREDIAKYIERRDGYKSDPDDIMLSNGASEAIKVRPPFNQATPCTVTERLSIELILIYLQSVLLECGTDRSVPHVYEPSVESIHKYVHLINNYENCKET